MAHDVAVFFQELPAGLDVEADRIVQFGNAHHVRAVRRLLDVKTTFEAHDHGLRSGNAVLDGTQRSDGLGYQSLMAFREHGDLVADLSGQTGSPAVGAVDHQRGIEFAVLVGAHALDAAAFGQQLGDLGVGQDGGAEVGSAAAVSVGAVEGIGMAVFLAEGSADDAFGVDAGHQLVNFLLHVDDPGLDAQFVLDGKVILEGGPFLVVAGDQQVAGLVQTAGTVVTGVFFQVFQNLGGFISQGGVQLGTPLLTDAGAAAAGSAGSKEASLNKEGIGHATLSKFERDRATAHTAADDNAFVILLQFFSR